MRARAQRMGIHRNAERFPADLHSGQRFIAAGYRNTLFAGISGGVRPLERALDVKGIAVSKRVRRRCAVFAPKGLGLERHSRRFDADCVGLFKRVCFICRGICRGKRKLVVTSRQHRGVAVRIYKLLIGGLCDAIYRANMIGNYDILVGSIVRYVKYKGQAESFAVGLYDRVLAVRPGLDGKGSIGPTVLVLLIRAAAGRGGIRHFSGAVRLLPSADRHSFALLRGQRR